MKRTEKLLCAVSLPALAALGGLYGLYRYAFRSPNRVQNDDYHITVNPQMNVFRAEITECITRLNALPYERVYITSADGLRELDAEELRLRRLNALRGIVQMLLRVKFCVMKFFSPSIFPFGRAAHVRADLRSACRGRCQDAL